MSISEVIAAEKQASPSAATDAEALGLAIAHHFHWDGISIMEAFATALEDANFHTESNIVSTWAKKERS